MLTASFFQLLDPFGALVDNLSRAARVSSTRYDVLDVAVLADNTKFVSCGEDKAAFLWDVSSGSVVRRFQGHEQRVNSCCFSADGGVFFTASYDKVSCFAPVIARLPRKTCPIWCPSIDDREIILRLQAPLGDFLVCRK